MNKTEKILAVIVVVVLIYFAVQGRKDTIEEMQFENDKLEDQVNELKEKVVKYASALNEANNNIELGDFMIEDAKSKSESGCVEMKKTLESLRIIRSATSPELIEKEFESGESKQETKTQESDLPLRGDVIVDPVIIRKDRAGVCHSPGMERYGMLANYEMFNSIEDCLNSGGRLPKE